MRKIIHVDMDCFYAAVEMRDNPQYQQVPLAVGGDGKRSVLSTCNYIARRHGVRSAMPAMRAKQLCPDLVIVHGRMDVYKEVSAHIREIFSRYTQLIEPLSLDEAYLDVTDCPQCQGSATLIAEEIRASIFRELQLTASAGVAPNKFLAKIASDENKPNGQCVVSPDKVAAFVEELPLRKIPGIGPKTAEKLASQGFTTCKDIRESSVAALTSVVGSFAERLYDYGFGQDHRSVKTNRVRKSVGVERTYQDDLPTAGACVAQLPNLMEKLLHRLSPHKSKTISKLGVKLKFNDFTQTTMETQGMEPDESIFADLIEKAFLRGEDKPVRLVGIFVGFREHKTSPEAQEDIQLALNL
ncbi:DNA polymerase IV [Thalassotalea euphylliae]|uniref:DNA polymerase IV n=1 Tax=Thalassotalea euphylliae TaxID=1655234 RepID=UPI00362D096B